MTFGRQALKRESVTISWLDSAPVDSPEASTIVMLHGLAGSSEEWRTVGERLAAHARVVLIDLRGHGHSSRHPADTTRRAFVDDVAAVITRVSPSRPVSVVGQSMGGHTAMLLAAWHPDLVQRLVVIEATAAQFDVREAKRLGDYFRGWAVPFKTREDAVVAIGGTAFAKAVSADLEERSDGFWPRFDPDTMQQTMEWVSEPRWEEWRAVCCPVLVVFAENGYFAETDRHAFLAKRPGTSACNVPGAGHDVHLEAPAAIISLLKDFLVLAGD